MDTISLTSLIVLGLASWRYAFFVTGDSLLEDFRDRWLDRYQEFAFGQRSKTQTLYDNLQVKLQDEKSADIRAELDQQTEKLQVKRTFHQGLSLKANTLFVCIYCLTFWTTLVTYNFFVWFANIGAIWAIATLIGVAHDKFFAEED